MAVRAFCVLLLLSGLAPPAFALDPGKAFHHYVRDSWSVQEGMPQISAAAIAQTPDGYIWVGTQSGITRFDGASFVTRDPATDPGLPNPVTSALATDDDGALWIGTRGGIAVLRGEHLDQVSWPGGGEEPHVFSLRPGTGGVVWAATTRGVARLHRGGIRLLPDTRSANVAVEVGGELWAGGVGGVYRWQDDTWVALDWPGGDAPPVHDLLEHDGELWAATGRGLWVRDGSGWRPFPGAGGKDALPLRLLYRDRDGNVWGGGDLGLVRVRPDGSVETVRASHANGLFNLMGVLEDREGNLWIGSLSNGLTRVWNGWTRRYTIQEGLNDATVWVLAPEPDGSGIWVGTNDGVAFLDEDGRFRIIPGTTDTEVAVVALFSEPGQLWVGQLNGLAVYAAESAGRLEVPRWARAIRAVVYGFSRDHDGQLWIGTSEGLLRWDGTTLEKFDERRGLAGSLAEHRVVTTQDGRRLALTRNGLFVLQGDRFVPAVESHDLPGDFTPDSLVELSDGRLLLTTIGGVLLRHGGRWHRIDESSGMFPGMLFKVSERDGVLWISGMHGVHRLPVSQLTAFAEGHLEAIAPEMVVNERGVPNGGQQGICCNGARGDSDGFLAGDTLWLPTRDGVMALDTLAITRNPVPPAVHVRPLQAPDEPEPRGTGGRTMLQAHQRDLTLAFDVLSFQDPRSNRAHYRLVGYDREWQVAEPLARQVRYTNLPPGDYVFEVLGSNNADVWTGAPARLEFGIQPRFHETAAFRVLLAVLAMALVYAGYRYQRHRYRLRQATLERLVEERTETLADTVDQLAESNGQLAESNRQLQEASLTDPLTGLRNRRYLTQQIPADLDYYDRQLSALPSDTVVFAMLDLDHFKQVNDVYGHATGDRVLEEAARRLRTLVRSGDYAVRWGGEEFLLVLRPMPSRHVATMGERLCGTISGTGFDIGDGRHIRLTASVGLAEYPLFHHDDQPLGWEAMIELADQAAYHVKRNGRDGWALFRPTPTTRTDTLLADLQHGPQALLRARQLELIASDRAAGMSSDSGPPRITGRGARLVPKLRSDSRNPTPSR